VEASLPILSLINVTEIWSTQRFPGYILVIHRFKGIPHATTAAAPTNLCGDRAFYTDQFWDAEFISSMNQKTNHSWALSILYQILSIEVCRKTMKIIGGWPDCGLTVSIAVLLFLVGSTTGGSNLPKQIEDVRLEQDSCRTLDCTTVLHNNCAGRAPTTQLL
jgi:hypothetical protein